MINEAVHIWNRSCFMSKFPRSIYFSTTNECKTTRFVLRGEWSETCFQVLNSWILVNICWHRNAGRWKCYKCSVWCLQCVAGCEGPMRAVPVCEAPPTEDRRVWRPVSVLLQSPHHPTGLTTGRGLIKLSYTNKWYRGHTLLQCGWKQQEKVQATGWRELLVEIWNKTKSNFIDIIMSIIYNCTVRREVKRSECFRASFAS